jgi:hypothetical protein
MNAAIKATEVEMNVATCVTYEMYSSAAVEDLATPEPIFGTSTEKLSGRVGVKV